MPEKRIRGSCLCGGIEFEIRGAPLWMAVCHCSRCRKAGGSTTVAVLAEQFSWLRGEELVERYDHEPPYHLVRCFCRVCGTYLGEPDLEAGGFPVAANALDDDPGLHPILHEHVADKPDWVQIPDDAPQYDGHPPGFGNAPEE